MKTTRQIFTTMLILIIARIGHAQTQVGVSAGMGGVTQSEVGDIYNNIHIAIGFNAGILLRQPMNESFALKTRLIYALKGQSFDAHEEVGRIKTTHKFTYLTLPVEVEYSVPVKKDRLFVGAGPYAGVLLDAKREVKGNSANLKDDVKNLDFGLVFELGFSKKCLWDNELQFSICYDMGLVKIADYNDDLYNKALTFNIGFLL